MKHVRTASVASAAHWVVRPYAHHRWLHPRSGQALIKVDGRVWNVARLLIEHAKVEGQGFVNTCSYEECVRPAHWLATKQAPQTHTVRGAPGLWQLWGPSAPIKRDTTIVAGVPAENRLHVVRVLVDPTEAEHRFVTACGVAYDPGLLVITSKRDANCNACLAP